MYSLIESAVVYFVAWLGCCQAGQGNKIANKIMHTLQIGFDLFKCFFNQTYILAVFNEKASKVILF